MTVKMPNRAIVKDRLVAVLKCSDSIDRKNGRVWYWRARMYCQSITKATYLTVYPRLAAAVIAALSPGVAWPVNQQQAWDLILGYRQLKRVDGITVSTYGSQLRKAVKILTWPRQDILDSEVEEVLGKYAYKTKAFYRNILYYKTDYESVTIDRHMLDSIGLDGLRLTAHRYEIISDCIRELAKQEKLIPNQLQATLWLTWKRLKKSQNKI